MVASMAVNELLARLHPFRTRPNGDFAIQRISMSHGRIILRPDGEPDANLASHVGRGTTNPPLLLPRLGRSEEHTSELQSLMRISYAVICLKKNNTHQAATRNTL